MKLDIMQWLSHTNNINEISQQAGHSRNLIHSIRNSFQSNQNIFELHHKLGARIKASDDIRNEVINMTIQNRRMPAQVIANTISQNNKLEPIPSSTVYSIKHEDGFRYLSPIHTFALTDIQRGKKKLFAQYYIDNDTSWDNVLFTNESYFELNSNHR